MRKNFLILMLLSLLPLASWAQFSVGNYVPKGNFVYEITQAADASTPGKVVLYGIRDGYNPVDADKALNLEGKITIAIVDGPSFDFVVDYANANALRNTFNWTSYTVAPTLVGAFAGMTTAESVVIPKEFLEIKQNTFDGYTSMKSISFEANSEVTTIESGSFSTTQIRTFDFSNCSKLTAISNGLFVEASPAINSYVETITLPANSEALTDIGTAFQRLPNLTAINNLDQSLITTVVADAFNGDTSLEALALPGTVQTIATDAFKGSGIENLTIDVTSLDDTNAGQVYGTAAGDLSTLRSLTLKGVLSGTFKPQAFKGCDELQTIDMTDMTINGGTIGDNAFENCVRLTSLTFNDITEGTIGNAAFKGCARLASVVFGAITGTDALDALIDDSAFENCPKLATITFGNLEHVTIDQDAFKKATDSSASSPAPALTFGTLTDVDINASAFEGCTKLTAITFGAADGLNIASKAFAGCTSGATTATLTFDTLKDVVITGTATGTGAFYNTTKLAAITFGESENLNIQTFAFENTASAISTATATLEFGDAKNLQIGVSAFKGASKLQTITFGNIEDDATPSVEIAANAFENTTGLQTLTFGNLTDVEIKGDAFNAATSALAGTDVATATFGDLVGSTIESSAFDGATKLESVTIGDMTNSVIGDGSGAVFPALAAATIGSIKMGTDNTAIGISAFTFKNKSAIVVNLASASGKSLETVAAATNALIDAGAFDFQSVTGATSFVYPVINIGEIKTTMTMDNGALKGNNIAKLVFKGNIAAGALDAMIVCDNSNAATNLTLLNTIIFNGEIATGGITANAFASLPAVMEITFNGKMAAAAVAAGAFEGLLQDSQVLYAYNGDDLDLTVNPFAKQAFKAGCTSADTRIIKFAVTNADLKAKYQDATAGLTTDGDFDVYLAYFYVPTVTDLSFKVYPDLANDASTAWARWELGARVDADVTGTLTTGTDLVIKRVQQVDGSHNAKITVYGTYTDEDDALNASTVYMVPLKAVNGYYHIPGSNKTTLIVKVESTADFTETSYKVMVNQTGYDAYDANVTTTGAGSIWPGLVNTDLYVASNIMTNQQLIDKQAADAANADATGVYGYYHAERTKSGDATSVDIYRGGTAIAENLYIMTDPSKNKGFRIDKNEISSTNNAYINTGWYYMLLKKYAGEPAAARVVWMGEDDNVTSILGVKKNVKSADNDGIYTLQGVRVDEMQKGKVYIVNGKKYIAK